MPYGRSMENNGYAASCNIVLFPINHTKTRNSSSKKDCNRKEKHLLCRHTPIIRKFRFIHSIFRQLRLHSPRQFHIQIPIAKSTRRINSIHRRRSFHAPEIPVQRSRRSGSRQRIEVGIVLIFDFTQ